MTEDDSYESNIDDGADYSEPFGGRRCVQCNGPTVGEKCGFCGDDLCPACFEMGGGFCGGKHTQEQIDAYEDEMMGPPTVEVIARRKARDELKAMGILL